MKNPIVAASLFASAALLAPACVVVSHEEVHHDPAQAEQAFAMIASLAGNWHGTAHTGAQFGQSGKRVRSYLHAFTSLSKFLFQDKVKKSCSTLRSKVFPCWIV